MKRNKVESTSSATLESLPNDVLDYIIESSNSELPFVTKKLYSVKKKRVDATENYCYFSKSLRNPLYLEKIVLDNVKDRKVLYFTFDQFPGLFHIRIDLNTRYNYNDLHVSTLFGILKTVEETSFPLYRVRTFERSHPIVNNDRYGNLLYSYLCHLLEKGARFYDAVTPKQTFYQRIEQKVAMYSHPLLSNLKELPMQPYSLWESSIEELESLLNYKYAVNIEWLHAEGVIMHKKDYHLKATKNYCDKMPLSSYPAPTYQSMDDLYPLE